MADKIIKSFDVWIEAKGLKSKGRLRNIDNISLEGIARVRELILELAVKGKLVSQNSKEEPANILLTRIAHEKEKLIRQGKLKAEKPLSEIKEEEIPFEVPNGWCLARLGNITNKIGSGSTPRGGRESYERQGILFLRSQNIWNHGIQLDDVAFISEATHEAMSGTKVIPNDILLNITGGSLGRSTIFPDDLGEANVSQHVTIIRPTNPQTRAFLHLCIISPYGQQLVWGRQVGANREGLSKKVLELFEIPLPPLAEQHRIVAKVDELMALCDELEKQETHHLKSHQLLVETLLGTLTQANNAAEFQTAWSRLAQHFDDIFTTEDSIDQLKQTILQLAVMGKLVPQDPNDEPASELLKRIEKEKEKLFSEGQIVRPKAIQILDDDQTPFQLPRCWIWTILGNAGLASTGKTPATGNSEYFGGDIPFIGPGQINEAGEITASEKSLTERGSLQSEIAKPGDILMVCIGGSIGKTAIAKFVLTFNQQINSIRPLFIKSEYLNFVMNCPFFNQRLLEKATGSATPIINRGKWEELPIPLAPVAEQERIVKKVDELFALCNQLKKRISESQKVVNQMAEAVLEQV